MPGWLIALIVIISVSVAILIIAAIVVAIVVPLVLLRGEAEICPDCNGNLTPYYLAQKDDKMDIDTLENLQNDLGTPLEFANNGQPILYVCDTSFPNSIPYYKTVTGCSSIKITTLFDTISSDSEEVCKVQFVGYAQDPSTLTSELTEPCCNLTPQYGALFVQASERHVGGFHQNAGQNVSNLNNAVHGVILPLTPEYNIDCLSGPLPEP